MEIWKDIKGYEGLYQVSNYGNVKSLNYLRTGKERILKQGTRKGGYKRVALCNNGEMKFYLVHRLVAEVFLENPRNLPQVNHKDENSSNNHVSNLEWCTPKENSNYGTRNKRIGNAHKGEKHHQARKVQCINTGEIFVTLEEAAEWSGIKKASNISRQIQSKRKSAGKHPVTKEPLQWKYID